ncbi:hypothetical protein PR048_032773 [Dryococelus australis]|uniref:Uncharacterized protein n=1 Tax=Dryococelus australis TaxID=614101 RepID=A0ABQ9G7C2_9NEOP|nr:hypothetical protein PR048_032773 [Dryococelus australis]
MVRLLTSHLGEPGFDSGRGCCQGVATGRWVFSGISRVSRPCIPAVLHSPLHFDVNCHPNSSAKQRRESAALRTCVYYKLHMTKANGIGLTCEELLHKPHHKLEVHGRHWWLHPHAHIHTHTRALTLGKAGGREAIEAPCVALHTEQTTIQRINSRTLISHPTIPREEKRSRSRLARTVNHAITTNPKPVARSPERTFGEDKPIVRVTAYFPWHSWVCWDRMIGRENFANPFRDKIDVKRIYSEVAFAIGSQFIRPALHASEPIAYFQGNNLANPITVRCGATANEHTAEVPVLTGLRSLAYRSMPGILIVNIPVIKPPYRPLKAPPHKPPTSGFFLDSSPAWSLVNEVSDEIWASVNIEVLRADESKARWVWGGAELGGGGEAGGPREDPPTNGIVRYNSHMLKSGSGPAGNRARFVSVGGEWCNHCTTAARSTPTIRDEKNFAKTIGYKPGSAILCAFEPKLVARWQLLKLNIKPVIETSLTKEKAKIRADDGRGHANLCVSSPVSRDVISGCANVGCRQLHSLFRDKVNRVAGAE